MFTQLVVKRNFPRKHCACVRDAGVIDGTKCVHVCRAINSHSLCVCCRITMLLVSDKYSWKDVRDAYLLENFNRNVLWIQKKFPDYCNESTPAFRRSSYALQGTDVSRKLAMFHVMFLKVCLVSFCSDCCGATKIF